MTLFHWWKWRITNRPVDDCIKDQRIRDFHEDYQASIAAECVWIVENVWSSLRGLCKRILPASWSLFSEQNVILLEFTSSLRCIQSDCVRSRVVYVLLGDRLSPLYPSAYSLWARACGEAPKVPYAARKMIVRRWACGGRKPRAPSNAQVSKQYFFYGPKCAVFHIFPLVHFEVHDFDVLSWSLVLDEQFSIATSMRT